MWNLVSRLWVVVRNPVCTYIKFQIEILLVLPWFLEKIQADAEILKISLGIGSISISIPWNLFELPPSSRIDIAKDNMIDSLVLFCLKNYTITHHMNSLMPGGDRKPYILREI